MRYICFAVVGGGPIRRFALPDSVPVPDTCAALEGRLCTETSEDGFVADTPLVPIGRFVPRKPPSAPFISAAACISSSFCRQNGAEMIRLSRLITSKIIEKCQNLHQTFWTQNHPPAKTSHGVECVLNALYSG